jgi:hypothetical protein
MLLCDMDNILWTNNGHTNSWLLPPTTC